MMRIVGYILLDHRRISSRSSRK